MFQQFLIIKIESLIIYKLLLESTLYPHSTEGISEGLKTIS